jgi:hypothetical protein
MPDKTAALTAWLEHCERHPELWKTGAVEIPLDQVGLTFDEAEALFDRPTLADVRTAVEAFIAEGSIDSARELQAGD